MAVEFGFDDMTTPGFAATLALIGLIGCRFVELDLTLSVLTP